MDRYAPCATLVVLHGGGASRHPKLVACAAGWGKPPHIEPAHQDSTEIIAISIVIFISVVIFIVIFIFLFLLVFIFILIFISFQAGGSPPTSRIILGN